MSAEVGETEVVGAISEDVIAELVSPSPEPVKKLFTQEEATKAVLKERARAYEKGKRDALMELDQQKSAPVEKTAAVVDAVNPEELRKLAENAAEKMLEERSKKQQEADLQARINSAQAQVQAKLNEAEYRLPDLKANISQLDPKDHEAASVIMVLANDMDNAADVLDSVFGDEDLTDRLVGYVEQGKFEKLKRAIVKINDSVSAKESRKSSAEPLLSVNPAKRAKIQSGGSQSVSELRSNPKFRV